MALIADVVVDCRHPAALARFWAAALDGYAVAPYDAAELARLRGLGIDDPGDDPTVLISALHERLRLWFQRVPEGKVVKNRVHLDLRSADGDAEAEARRLVALGATSSMTSTTTATPPFIDSNHPDPGRTGSRRANPWWYSRREPDVVRPQRYLARAVAGMGPGGAGRGS